MAILLPQRVSVTLTHGDVGRRSDRIELTVVTLRTGSAARAAGSRTLSARPSPTGVRVDEHDVDAQPARENRTFIRCAFVLAAERMNLGVVLQFLQPPREQLERGVVAFAAELARTSGPCASTRPGR